MNDPTTIVTDANGKTYTVLTSSLPPSNTPSTTTTSISSDIPTTDGTKETFGDMETLLESPSDTVSPGLDLTSVAPVTGTATAGPAIAAGDLSSVLTADAPVVAPDTTVNFVHNASIGQIILALATRYNVNPNLALAVAQFRSSLNWRQAGNGYGLYGLPLDVFSSGVVGALNPIENAVTAMPALGKLDVATLPSGIADIYNQLEAGANPATVLPEYNTRTGVGINVNG